LVKFQKNARGQVTYSAQISNILTIHQYPKLTYCAKVTFGDAAELIIEELLHHGSMTMSSVVANVTNRLLDPALSQSDQIDYEHVANQFVELVKGHLIKRSLGDEIMVISKGNEEAKLDVVRANDMEYDLPLGYITSGIVNRALTLKWQCAQMCPTLIFYSHCMSNARQFYSSGGECCQSMGYPIGCIRGNAT
jgi:hypothetical protein